MIKENTQDLLNLIHYSPNEIYIIDYDTNKYLFVNTGACKISGYSKEELLKMDVFDIDVSLTCEKFDNLKKKFSDKDTIQSRAVYRKKDGSSYNSQTYMHTIQYENKKAIVIFNNNISDIVELKQKYKKQADILEHIHDSIISTDLDGNILSYNKGSEILLGFTKDEAIGKNILDIYGFENPTDLKSLQKILEKNNEYDMEAYLTKKDGTRIICDIYLSAVRNEQNEMSGMVGYSLDITDKKEAENLIEEQAQRLRHQAYYDILTDLPNRVLFQDRLSQAIKMSKRNNEKFALLFIDLDKFKHINDSLGHPIGDKVLLEASKRLKSSIRDEDTLSRIGGDEFTIIIRKLQKNKSASIVAKKILKIMKKPIIVNNKALKISASVGISIFPDDTKNEHKLIKFSDKAMYKAKVHRNTFKYYKKR